MRGEDFIFVYIIQKNFKLLSNKLLTLSSNYNFTYYLFNGAKAGFSVILSNS